MSRGTRRRDVDLEGLPQPICEYCGLEIDDDGRDHCPARESGGCRA
jgi:hypothetical protein